MVRFLTVWGYSAKFELQPKFTHEQVVLGDVSFFFGKLSWGLENGNALWMDITGCLFWVDRRRSALRSSRAGAPAKHHGRPLPKFCAVKTTCMQTSRSSTIGGFPLTRSPCWWRGRQIVACLFIKNYSCIHVYRWSGTPVVLFFNPKIYPRGWWLVLRFWELPTSPPERRRSQGAGGACTDGLNS